MAIAAVPLGPGWSGRLCVPGPSFIRSGFSRQTQSGLGAAMPITHDAAKEWAYHGLVLAPSMGYDELGGWWPSRSLVVRWYADAFDSFSLRKSQYYYKANDHGTFDLAMPVGESRSCGAAYNGARAAVAAHRYEKAYVMPPAWEADAYDRWEEFMDSAVRSVIMDELVKAPPNLRPFKGAELNFRKRARFDVERRHYLQWKGCAQLEVERRSCGSQFLEVAPPGFSLAPRTPWAAGAYSVVSGHPDAGLNDWDGGDPEEDEGVEGEDSEGDED